MDQKCFSIVRGRVLRATALDRCGRIETGPCVSVVTDGFISIGYTSRVTEGEAINVVKANGGTCINDAPPPKWEGHGITATFCEVNPLLFEMLTGQPVIYDADGVPIGFDAQEGIDLAGRGVALELWSDVPSDACDPDDVNAEGAWGYSILPFLQGGVLGDRTIENAAITFTIQGMNTRKGSAWDVGPYNVMLDETGTPGPLLTPITTKTHERFFFTSVAPPEPGCACEASGPAATGATAGTPATWTPADSYAPETFAALTTANPTASPNTAWTAGQYVVLGDDSEAHWNGTAWAAGRA
jgi:hypothetical protein